jgi:hypothetical protein
MLRVGTHTLAAAAFASFASHQLQKAVTFA